VLRDQWEQMVKLRYVAGGIVALAVVGAMLPNSKNTAKIAEPPEIQPPLQSFEFRGLKPGTTTLGEAKKAKTVEYCDRFNPNENEDSCDFVKYSIGEIATGNGSVKFVNGKFDWFHIKLPTDNFDRLIEQTTKIYGKPCSLSTEQLQNGFGAKFQGDEVKWCFKEGDLTVRRHAKNDFTWGEFYFFTDHPAPPAKEFNASTL
jgi:hypothetical protein